MVGYKIYQDIDFYGTAYDDRTMFGILSLIRMLGEALEEKNIEITIKCNGMTTKHNLDEEQIFEIVENYF